MGKKEGTHTRHPPAGGQAEAEDGQGEGHDTQEERQPADLRGAVVYLCCV